MSNTTTVTMIVTNSVIQIGGQKSQQIDTSCDPSVGVSAPAGTGVGIEGGDGASGGVGDPVLSGGKIGDGVGDVWGLPQPGSPEPRQSNSRTPSWLRYPHAAEHRVTFVGVVVLSTMKVGLAADAPVGHTLPALCVA